MVKNHQKTNKNIFCQLRMMSPNLFHRKIFKISNRPIETMRIKRQLSHSMPSMMRKRMKNHQSPPWKSNSLQLLLSDKEEEDNSDETEKCKAQVGVENNVSRVDKNN